MVEWARNAVLSCMATAGLLSYGRKSAVSVLTPILTSLKLRSK